MKNESEGKQKKKRKKKKGRKRKQKRFPNRKEKHHWTERRESV